MMEIRGWGVRADENDNMLRPCRGKEGTHYVVTLLREYAIDIELLKEEIDKIPKEDLLKYLIDLINKVITSRGG